jgi:hypothetical protein
VAVPPTPSLLVAPPPPAGGGEEDTDRNNILMTPRCQRWRSTAVVDFLHGESGGGNDNNVALAPALANADAADSGDCAIREGG